MSRSGVYEIRNLSDGKRYVGSTKDLSSRKSNHFYTLRNGRNKNQDLQRAWDKYGESSIEFVVVLECPKEELLEREQEIIDSYDFDSLYNVQPVAGSPIGMKHSQEARDNISKGKIGGVISQEHRDAISRTKTGRAMSEEARAKMSVSQSGRKHSEEARKNMSIAQKGHKVSDETRLKISMAAKGHKRGVGRVCSEETRARISESRKRSKVLLGKTHSKETIQKMSDSQKKRWAKRKEEVE